MRSLRRSDEVAVACDRFGSWDECSMKVGECEARRGMMMAVGTGGLAHKRLSGAYYVR